MNCITITGGEVLEKVWYEIFNYSILIDVTSNFRKCILIENSSFVT